MRRLVAAAVIAALSAVFLPTASAGTPEIARKVALRDSYVRFASVEGAHRHDAAGPWRGLDWRDNGCHVPRGIGGARAFYPACNQHDFCYRNLPIGGPNGARTRLACDKKLRGEARRVCRMRRPTAACRALADTYYRAIRRREWPDF